MKYRCNYCHRHTKGAWCEFRDSSECPLNVGTSERQKKAREESVVDSRHFTETSDRVMCPCGAKYDRLEVLSFDSYFCKGCYVKRPAWAFKILKSNPTK